MKDKTSKYKEDDSVRVLPGVTDPDFNTTLSGWTGKVEELDLSDNGSWLYCIRWDKDTLSKVGDDYIDKCEDKNLDYELMYLEEQELELVNNQETQKDDFFLA